MRSSSRHSNLIPDRNIWNCLKRIRHVKIGVSFFCHSVCVSAGGEWTSSDKTKVSMPETFAYVIDLREWSTGARNNMPFATTWWVRIDLLVPLRPTWSCRNTWRGEIIVDCDEARWYNTRSFVTQKWTKLRYRFGYYFSQCQPYSQKFITSLKFKPTLGISE